MFRELIYSTNNVWARHYASKLQVEFYNWREWEREHCLLWGKGSILGLVHICTNYPELRFVYNKVLSNEYNF